MHKKIKTTITLSSHIKEFAAKEAESLGLDFSAYITILIAEKLRGTSLLGNNVPTTATSTSALPSEDTNFSIEPKEIDTSQIDELDRLLSLNDD